MDWGKAKTILIAVFLLLNTFLLVNIGINKLSQNDSREAIASTIAILKNKGIELQCEVPSESKSMGKLELHAEAYFDMDKIISNLLDSKDLWPAEFQKEQNLKTGSREITILSAAEFNYSDSNPRENWNINQLKTVEKHLSKFLKSKGITPSEFVVDEYEKNVDGSWKVIYVQKFEEFFIFDNTITLIVAENGVKHLSYCVRRPVLSARSGEKVIAAYKVLLTNYGNLSNQVITSMDLGYTMIKLDKNMKSFFERPVWRVKDSEGIKYFDAYTGEPK